MEVVTAGLGSDQDGGTRARAPFGGIVVGENLELLDGVDGWQDGDAAGGQLIVVVAVKQPIGAIGAGSAHRKREGSAGGDFAAGTSIEKAAGIGFLDGAGGQGGELDEVAAIQGKLGDLLGGDHLAQSGIGSFNGDGGSGDFDALL